MIILLHHFQCCDDSDLANEKQCETLANNPWKSWAIKMPLYLFDNLSVSWRILTFLVPMDTRMNTLQCTYLLFLISRQHHKWVT